MRLRFTIRDLLWLTVVAALAVGWWVAHLRWADEAARKIEAIEKEHQHQRDVWVGTMDGLKNQMSYLMEQLQSKPSERKGAPADSMPILRPRSWYADQKPPEDETIVRP